MVLILAPESKKAHTFFLHTCNDKLYMLNKMQNITIFYSFALYIFFFHKTKSIKLKKSLYIIMIILLCEIEKSILIILFSSDFSNEIFFLF